MAIDALENEASDQGLTADKFDVKFIGFLDNDILHGYRIAIEMDYGLINFYDETDVHIDPY